MWPYRFGVKPSTIRQKYGPALVTPSMMPGATINEDDLPKGLAAATAYLAGKTCETPLRANLREVDAGETRELATCVAG